MSNTSILADSFVVQPHGIEIFRIAHQDSATLLWTSRDHAVRYLQKLNDWKLQARTKSQ